MFVTNLVNFFLEPKDHWVKSKRWSKSLQIWHSVIDIFHAMKILITNEFILLLIRILIYNYSQSILALWRTGELLSIAAINFSNQSLSRSHDLNHELIYSFPHLSKSYEKKTFRHIFLSLFRLIILIIYHS